MLKYMYFYGMEHRIVILQREYILTSSFEILDTATDQCWFCYHNTHNYFTSPYRRTSVRISELFIYDPPRYGIILLIHFIAMYYTH